MATPDDIGKARSIAETITGNEAVDPRTRVAIRRWKNSGTTWDVADQSIELRIAFEALYVRNSQAATYKVASRCAWYLREPGDERKELYREVKKFYGLASDFAHGRSKKAKMKDKTRIEKARSTCRDGILKFLDEPVDLTRLSLG